MKKLAAVVLSIVIAGFLCTQGPVYASGEGASNDMSSTITSSETMSVEGVQEESGVAKGFSLEDSMVESVSAFGLRALSDSNVCGENLTWTLESGTLSISGTGAMTDYVATEKNGVTTCTTPWFASREDITSVVIESGVTTVGECAFYGLANLKSVSIADSVTELKRAAFHKCTSLEQLALPSSVKTIDDGALSGCTSLKDFSASGLVEVGEYAFEETNLTEFVIPEALETLAETTFYKCQIEIFSSDGQNEVFSVLDGVLYCDEGQTLFAFPNGSEKTSFTLPENIICIASCAFAYNENLQEINLNNGLETIGDSAFLAAGALTGVQIPDSVTELGTYAFSSCKNLLTVTVGSGIDTIYSGTFINCKKLQQVVLKDGVEEIHKKAFYGCDALENVTLPASLDYSHPLSFSSSTNIECLNAELENHAEKGYGYYQKVSIDVNQHYDKAFEVLQYINDERAKANTQLKPLVMQQELLDAAMERAGEIAVLFSHTRPNGTRCFTIDDLVYAENVAAGHTTASLVMYGNDTNTDGWMDSATHCANILSSSAKSVGVGCVEHNGTYYWVQCFGYDDVDENASCQQPENQSKDQVIMITLDAFGEASNYADDMYDINPGNYQFDPIIDTDETADKIVASVHLVNPGYSFNTAKLNSDNEDAWIRWSSDDESVAAIDATGVVAQGAFGVANIYAEMKYYHRSVPYVVGVQRLAGNTRYETMLEIADALKAVNKVEKFNAAIIATGENYADALSGSYLAAALDAPILLVNTAKSETITTVVDYIYENVQEDGKLYILGGEVAVGVEIESYLEDYDVKRLKGDSRYATNIAILEEAEALGFSSNKLLVCTGEGYADSLSASATGMPIVLASPKDSKVNMDYVAKSGVENIYIIGGKAAVPETIEKELKKYAPIKRLAGNSRYETTLVVANEFFKTPSAAVLAYGKNFPDGLCGGPLAEAMNAPLILTTTNNAAYAEVYAKDAEINSGAVLGGPILISDNVVREIFSMDAKDTIVDIKR